MSYNAEELNNMKVEELKKIASSMKISHSKVLKRDLIQRILSASERVASPSASPSRSRSRSRSSSVLSESMLKSKTASELRKIIIDNKDLYNCAATKISGDKSGKELMINIILDKIKCPREYKYDRSPSPKRSPSPAKKKSPSKKRAPSPAKKKSPSKKRSPSPAKKKSFSREELEKMTQKQLVELVKNMGLDDICKVSVAKPVLIEYILNEDCQLENRKKGKEKIERVKKVKPSSPLPSAPSSPSPSPRKDEDVYNKKDLEKMTQKHLIEIVKNMGLDDVCKVSVTKPELINYILNKDCDKKNRKKGKENVVLRPTSPKSDKIPSPKSEYNKDELERMTTKELTEIVKKKGIDEKCKLAVPKSVLISYIIKNDCQKEYIKKGYKEKDEKEEETPYQKLSKLSDEEIRDILRVYDLDEICDMNVSRETLIKYIINKGCPDNLKPKQKVPVVPIPKTPSPVPSPEPSEPSLVPSPEPSEPSPVPSPEPSPISAGPSPLREEPEEESDSDVSSVDEEEEDLEAVNRKKIAEMSRALRECLGFSQKKL